MNEKEIAKMFPMILAFFQLDPQKFEMADQFLYLSVILRFAKEVEPLVKKYGGSVEELQATYNKMKAEQDMKELLAAGYLKALKDATNKEDE